MAIEPHSNNKLLQDILDKLNSQSGIQNHEQLLGLLGGDASGHFHVTASQLQQLDNILTGGNNHERLSGLLGGDAAGHFHLSQDELNKLSGYPIFSSLHHESLQGLLGGNAYGHYHLTVDLLNKLISLPASGVSGSDGAAATIQIGTVTTGAAGTNASVTNSGTSTNAIFNFVIPRGDKGDKGDKGDTGAAGSAGSGSYVDIINNLSSTRTDAALSAYQGKVLNDKINTLSSDIPSPTAIIDNLNSTRNDAALSAYQGKILNDKINNKLDSSSLNFEAWTFTLEDGSTITKSVGVSA